jgi:hypothetical protein
MKEESKGEIVIYKIGDGKRAIEVNFLFLNHQLC